MITRIKIDGFKSLVDTELYLGPFNCIAGANAIGKSNFFDALMFLSALADNTLMQAAKSIRSEDQKNAEIKDIFYRNGSFSLPKILFEIDMLIKPEGEDDLGQSAMAKITSVRYTLEIAFNGDNTEKEPIEIVREFLQPISQEQAKKKIYFDYDPTWIKSVMKGKAGTPFISTDKGKIKLHQDGNKGRTSEFIAERMPRTLLSTVTAESPTAFLVRKEMRNWMMLQFEPSALRLSNSTFEVKNAAISVNGHNLPATLYRLQSEKKNDDLYQELTNKLRGLVDDVKEILIDKDEKRDILTLQIRFKDGVILSAPSLSDGTLRFLGLAILDQDGQSSSVLCLEEPENGINPKKVHQMVELLQDMATDTEEAVDDSNPLRQVIINTHSPIVVADVPDESLYLAKSRDFIREGQKLKCTGFSALQDTWKTEKKLIAVTSKGEILNYLSGRNQFKIKNESVVSEGSPAYRTKKRKRTVAENVFQYNLFDQLGNE